MNVDKPVCKNGLFVVFEGIDGSGKTTVSKEIYAMLLNNKLPSAIFFEPTKEGFGKTIRERAKSGNRFTVATEASLFVLDRNYNKNKNLITNLNYKILLLDRYFYSSIAYQGFMGILTPEMIFDMNKPVILNPDLVFIFDIDVDIAFDRIESRVKIDKKRLDSYEHRNEMHKVKKIYDEMVAENIIRIDANKNLTDIVNECYTLIVDKFNIKFSNDKFV